MKNKEAEAVSDILHEADTCMTLKDVIEVYKEKGWDFDLPIFVAGRDGGEESFLLCLQASFYGLDTDGESCILFRREPGPQLDTYSPPLRD